MYHSHGVILRGDISEPKHDTPIPLPSYLISLIHYIIIYLQQPCKLGLSVGDVSGFLVRQRLYDFPQGGERQVDALALGERRPRVVGDACKW